MAGPGPRCRLRLALGLCGVLAAGPAAAASSESVKEALCRLIDRAALDSRVPASFLTRLIWQESSFRAGVTSPAGAQGIAQFMPGTARERGLMDPFDPEQAIPKAAELILELSGRFGNLGLAAAAYNGGPARVASWLAGRGWLPPETRNYVYSITGRPAEDWASEAKEARAERDPDADKTKDEGQTCLQTVAALKVPGQEMPDGEAFAPWGVQLAGNFLKRRALESYARASRAYAGLLGEVRPMIIGTRLRSRGTRIFYRVRVPAATRQEANQLCDRIRKVGGSCIALPT